MNTLDLSKAITGIDDYYILESEREKTHSKARFVTLIAAALILTASLTLFAMIMANQAENSFYGPSHDSLNGSIAGGYATDTTQKFEDEVVLTTAAPQKTDPQSDVPDMQRIFGILDDMVKTDKLITGSISEETVEMTKDRAGQTIADLLKSDEFTVSATGFCVIEPGDDNRPCINLSARCFPVYDREGVPALLLQITKDGAFTCLPAIKTDRIALCEGRGDELLCLFIDNRLIWLNKENVLYVPGAEGAPICTKLGDIDYYKALYVEGISAHTVFAPVYS